MIIILKFLIKFMETHSMISQEVPQDPKRIKIVLMKKGKLKNTLNFSKKEISSNKSGKIKELNSLQTLLMRKMIYSNLHNKFKKFKKLILIKTITNKILEPLKKSKVLFTPKNIFLWNAATKSQKKKMKVKSTLNNLFKNLTPTLYKI